MVYEDYPPPPPPPRIRVGVSVAKALGIIIIIPDPPPNVTTPRARYAAGATAASCAVTGVALGLFFSATLYVLGTDTGLLPFHSRSLLIKIRMKTASPLPILHIDVSRRSFLRTTELRGPDATHSHCIYFGYFASLLSEYRFSISLPPSLTSFFFNSSRSASSMLHFVYLHRNATSNQFLGTALIPIPVATK
ncbi:hypothetical protein C8J57DRAFT_429175 [Mycena rebaudengoi]|nr:hypothetical protein C8J57DRAFT_429175 [Mycena rebaudengoi]